MTACGGVSRSQVVRGRLTPRLRTIQACLKDVETIHLGSGAGELPVAADHSRQAEGKAADIEAGQTGSTKSDIGCFRQVETPPLSRPYNPSRAIHRGGIAVAPGNARLECLVERRQRRLGRSQIGRLGVLVQPFSLAAAGERTTAGSRDSSQARQSC